MAAADILALEALEESRDSTQEDELLAAEHPAPLGGGGRKVLAVAAVLLATAAGVAAVIGIRPSSATVIGEHLLREYSYTPSYDPVYGHGDAYHATPPAVPPAVPSYHAPPMGYPAHGYDHAPPSGYPVHSYDPVYGHGDAYHGTAPLYHPSASTVCKYRVGHHVMVQQGNTFRHAIVEGVLPGCNYQVQLTPHQYN